MASEWLPERTPLPDRTPLPPNGRIEVTPLSNPVEMGKDAVPKEIPEQAKMNLDDSMTDARYENSTHPVKLVEFGQKVVGAITSAVSQTTGLGFLQLGQAVHSAQLGFKAFQEGNFTTALGYYQQAYNLDLG